MSDLNDFFAKKDRKKKKAATRSAVVSAPPEGKKVEKEDEVDVAAAGPRQSDDGWIEIEDPKGAQVNTGGRTVVEFKRDVEEKEQANDGNTPIEKFSGWGATAPEKANDDEAEGEEAVPSTAFPSLADAANAPQVPVSRGKSSSSSASEQASAARRPRFINSNREKLRQKLTGQSGVPSGK